MPRLVVQDVSGERRSVNFERRAFVGRECSNDLLLDDPRSSRHHAVFYRDEGGLFWVEDLQSRNGTFLGEERIQRAQIGHGAWLRIGATKIRFELPLPQAGTRDSLLLDPSSLTTEAGTRLPILAAPSGTDDTDESRRAYRGLVAMYELGNLLHGERSEREVYGAIARLAAEVTGAQLVTIAELEPGSAEPRVRCSLPEEGLPGSDFEISRTVLQQVLEEGRAVLLADVPTDRGMRAVKSLCEARIRTLLCAPLRSRENVLGVVTAVCVSESQVFGHQELQLLTAMGLQAGIALENRGLTRQLELSYLATVEALVNALDAKDEYTAGHARRVAELSQAIGRRMGLSGPAVQELRLGALLHDVGKIGVAEAVLGAPRRLTDEEYLHVQQHTVFGDKIMRPLLASDRARAIVRNHHERWDGGGYPDGLAGQDIPLSCRIVAVADTLDAITSRRPYRDEGELVGALREVQRCAGSQFDPAVVRALLEVAVAEGGLEPLLSRAPETA